MLDSNFDLVALTETWLCSTINSEELFNGDFVVYRKDRSCLTSQKSIGGGTLLAIKKEFNSTVLDSDDSIEQLWIKVILRESILYVCCLYIAPDSTDLIYSKHIQSINIKMKLLNENDSVLIFGDFNLPNIVWKDICEFDSDLKNYLIPFDVKFVKESCIVDGMSFNNLLQINSIRNCNFNLLDLVFCNIENDCKIYKSDYPLVSVDKYHVPVEIIIQIEAYTPLEDVSSFRDFKKANYSIINTELESHDWQKLLTCTDVDCDVEMFYNIVMNIINKHIPTKYNHINKRKPWTTPFLTKLKNRRNKAHKKFNLSKNQLDYLQYSNLRKKFNDLNGFLYNNYLNDMQRKIKENPKEFWTFIKSKSKSSGIPQSMSFGNEIGDDFTSITNLFADFFKSVYLMVGNPNIQVENKALSHNITSSIQLDELSVRKALTNVKITKGCGPDGIPSIFVRNCASSLAVPLTMIFNSSMQLGVFPKRWKTSYISPIFKSGKRNNIENYRGIAKLSVIPKLFEKIITEILQFQTRQLISNAQHGFIKGRSTSSNLIEFVSFVINSIETGYQVDVIYTDFSKAFDKIDHSTICKKLEDLGFTDPLLSWIRSYLTDRQQSVKIGNSESYVFDVTSGVPQGSHLGPLLFILFINDIGVNFDSNHLVYADDCKIFRKISTVDDCRKLQNDLDTFNSWCEDNMLQPNVKKCLCMSFHRKQIPIRFEYKMGNHILRNVEEISDLGILLDAKLNFTPHIDYIISKSFAMLGFVFRNISEFTDPYAMKALYVTLVRSVLEYGSNVWSPNYMFHIRRIESVQKRFIYRALKKLHWTSFPLPPSSNRCRLIGLDTLEKRRSIALAMFVADVLQGRISSSFILQKLSLIVPSRALRPRRELLAIECHRTNYGKYEPVTNMIKVFNSNIVNFDFHNSRTEFKSNLLTNYCSQNI